jgi:hypothetical protein
VSAVQSRPTPQKETSTDVGVFLLYSKPGKGFDALFWSSDQQTRHWLINGVYSLKVGIIDLI